MNIVNNHSLIDKYFHWLRYTSGCHLCHLNYNLIIKTETLQYDSEVYTKAVGIQDNKEQTWVCRGGFAIETE